MPYVKAWLFISRWWEQLLELTPTTCNNKNRKGTNLTIQRVT